MKSTNQEICEFVAKNPLCFTSDVAYHIGHTTEHVSKLMNRLESTDHLRVPTKSGRLNRWIVGANQRFNASTNYYDAQGNGGGRYYPTNGNIDRKRVATVSCTAEDALALLATGYSKMKVF
jgi:hypothetical protein